MYDKSFMSAESNMDTTIAMLAEVKKRNGGSTPGQR
jgi:hypothetical protein